MTAGYSWYIVYIYHYIYLYIWLHVIIIHQPEMLGDLKDFKGLAAEDNPATQDLWAWILPSEIIILLVRFT
jgi:hypothetical protein